MFKSQKYKWNNNVNKLMTEKSLFHLIRNIVIWLERKILRFKHVFSNTSRKIQNYHV